MAMKLTKNIGMLLLGIWLILEGLIPLLNLSFSGLGTLMEILAIAAGAFILLEGLFPGRPRSIDAECPETRVALGATEKLAVSDRFVFGPRPGDCDLCHKIFAVIGQASVGKFRDRCRNFSNTLGIGKGAPWGNEKIVSLHFPTMCGCFAQSSTSESYAEPFGVEDRPLGNLAPRYNVAPHKRLGRAWWPRPAGGTWRACAGAWCRTGPRGPTRDSRRSTPGLRPSTKSLPIGTPSGTGAA